MAKLCLRPKEAILVLGVCRMTLHMWERKGLIQKETSENNHVHYIIYCNIDKDGNIEVTRAQQK